MTWPEIAVVALAALLLASERACYVAVWRAPETFRRHVAPWADPTGDPVLGLANLFVGFKVLQASVFVGWCLYWGGGRVLPLPGDPVTLATGAALVAAGQLLNASVFVRLGTIGVFYGNRFGHAIDWRSGFPFSWFRHPQYVGTVLTIWGVFLILRFPAPDWIVLPLIETAYYVGGSWLEDDALPP